MKNRTGRRSIVVATLAIAAATLAACVSETPATATRVEALNISPPPNAPAQPTQPTLVWVPGHYNTDGAWVPGRWRKI